MRDTVVDAQGLGLAAPQVGISKRFCLAQFGGSMQALINPNILSSSAETDIMEEGCLSLPKIGVNVERPIEITLRYQDEHGTEQERHLRGLDARVVQHELDHLDGVLIVDYT